MDDNQVMTDGNDQIVTDDNRYAADHCEHHQHDDTCGGYYDDCDNADSDDYCVHCDCCCTCLGCEYGPRDGMLLTPEQRAVIGEVTP